MADKKTTKAKKASAQKKKTSKRTTPKKQNSQGLLAMLKPESGWGETVRFVAGLICLAVALFLILAFVSQFFAGQNDQGIIESNTGEHVKNYAGKLGALSAHYFINRCFGVCAFFIPLFLLMLSMKLMRTYKVRLWKWFLNFSILMIWGSVALSFCQKHFFPDGWTNVPWKWGGDHGDNICNMLENPLGPVGAAAILIVLAILYLMYITGETVNVIRQLLNPKPIIDKTKEKGKQLWKKRENEEDEPDTNDVPFDTEEDGPEDEPESEEIEIDTFTQEFEEEPEPLDEPLDVEIIDQEEQEAEPQPAAEALAIDEIKQEEKADSKTLEAIDFEAMKPYDPRKDLEHYHFPTLSLLKKYDDQLSKENIDKQEQNDNANRIRTVLKDFGVDITGIRATIGPTVTLYEVTPAPGVRISKIRNLGDDIALSLSAIGVRIIAPIPGKGTIGIEVPNKNPKIVSMESILNSKRFKETTYDLPIALGKTITNEVFMVDLAKMPHLLVAGATGQGKSVGLNAIITSLLYKKHPSELKIVMVDPKKVEFSIYNPIEKHFLAGIPDTDETIITDTSKVVQTLKSLCTLMDHRYDLLKMAGARNIKEYNEKFISRQLNPKNGHEFLPYIVIIIDEFGDLIMTAGKEVELPIARIAQLARAVGMHMVIATQRPTTNIITGTIKANFPARMAFKVASNIDSRTILDRTGADQLIGRGDMLFLAGNEPVRVQCAFVDTPEVKNIVDYISKQQGYVSYFELPEPPVEEGSGGAADVDTGRLDALFSDAARLIVAHQSGSTSLIQRKFAIGYNRAGKIMDQMEAAGIVGPTRGSKPREVLIQDEVSLQAKLESLGQN